MQKKLFLTYIFVIVLTIMFAVGLSWRSMDRYFVEKVEEETQIEGTMIKKLIQEVFEEEDDLGAYVGELADLSDVRITLIDMQGKVLIDSDNEVDKMDNHANRPEVRGALRGYETSSSRYSNTMETAFYYYAMPIETLSFDGVVRVSVAVNEIQAITFDMISIIFIGIGFGAVLAIAVAYFVTKRLMMPVNELTSVAKIIAEGNYDEKIYISQNDQIGELADAFNSMTFVLRKNIWELTRKNAELESILTSMSSGLAAINNDYKLALYNDNFLKMLDLPDGDLQGKYFYEFARQLTVFEMVERSIKEQIQVTDEAKIMVDGEETVVQITATPIFDKEVGHKSLGVLVILMDVTQIRKLEHMRRNFVSNVTHELKTPLTSIRGFVDTLKGGAIKQEDVALRFLDIIDIETDRLSMLIQDILSLSEIETIVGEKNVDVYPLTEIIDEVIDIIPAPQEGVEIIKDIQADLPNYKCNKNRMKQLLINLVDNSVKYTEQGYVKVKAYESYGFLHLIVEDTGMGIEHKHLSRIFERFYRIDKGRSRKMGGTGLGLSIVKHIVELYNGDIKIESAVGEGTTISIKMPY